MPDTYPNIPERSERGRAALDIFYDEFNEVNFYIEDSEQENFYFQIFKTHFPNVKIERIFPLSGKSSVIGHARDNSNSKIKARVYLLDKDFDDLLGKKIEQSNIFYLDKFCIENYLLEPKAFIEVAIECDPKLRFEPVKRAIDFEALLAEINDALSDLFAIFYLVQKHGLELKNCSEKPERFCLKNRLWKLDPSKLESYRIQFNELALQVGAPPITTDMSIDVRLEGFGRSGKDEIISGKFVLAMFFHLLKHKFPVGNVSFSSLTYRLCKNCDLDEFRPVANRIKEYLASS